METCGIAGIFAVNICVFQMWRGLPEPCRAAKETLRRRKGRGMKT